MRRSWLVLAGVLSLSCAGPKPTASTTSATRERQADEIIALDRQIQEWRLKLGLPPDPGRTSFSQPDSPWSPVVAPTAQCEDVCRIAEHICSNKDDICRIADELPGDTWAEDKCKSAKASCIEAKERCRNCGK